MHTRLAFWPHHTLLHVHVQGNPMVGDPIYLINSAQYGNSTNPEGNSGNGDACYTLIQPINTQ